MDPNFEKLMQNFMTEYIIETFDYFFKRNSRNGEFGSNVIKLKVSYLSYLIQVLKYPNKAIIEVKINAK